MKYFILGCDKFVMLLDNLSIVYSGRDAAP